MKRYSVVLIGVAGILCASHMVVLQHPAEPPQVKTIIPVEIDVLTATIRIVAHPCAHASALQLREVLDAAEQD